MSKKHSKLYTLGEEIFNAISHGIGCILGLIGCIIGIVYAVLYGDVWSIVAMSIYGVTLIIMYCMSTLYHSITNQKAKQVFRILDHCTIFMLIAGTYTPYALVTLRESYFNVFGLNISIGWSILAISWGVTVVGIILNSIGIERFKVISMVCYIATGWLVVFAFKPLMDNLAQNGVLFLAIGGLFYTVGIVFYAMKKFKYMHSIWHLFVLTGSIFHYFSVLFYVLPNK